MKTVIISANEDGAIAAAVEHLVAGNLVAVPTETVYGLAADATNFAAVHKIYQTKGRPDNNPLICHVNSAEMAEEYVETGEIAQRLMNHFWPGPLTLVLERKANIDLPEAVSAGLPTLAVRCPASKTTLAIIKELGCPIAAPSANPSGKLSPTCAEDVLEGLGRKIPLIIDGGTTSVGLESTIAGIQDGKITMLRPGSVTAEELSNVAALPVYDRDDNTITAPGQLASHYAPDARVRLNAVKAGANEILIGFGAIKGSFSLSRSGNIEEAATNLYAVLRAADKCGTASIAIAPIPETGIGIAINDRLRRAAAPRDPS